jgi:prevent-host-death family protein
MKTVGIRELKNRLSEYLRSVRAGEGVLVTDRGEVVAELAPPGLRDTDPTVPAGLVALARQGLVTLATPRPSRYPALPRVRRSLASQLLDDERGSR